MKRIITIFFIVIINSILFSEESKLKEHPFSISTSIWSIANFFEDPADFYQLTFGFDIDENNTIYLNGLTWKYNESIGIPYGPSFESDEESYPGYVRSIGIGIGYQRSLWKGAFAAVYVTPFYQTYYGNDDKKIQTGFQLFLQGQLGYEFNLLDNRLFIKPSLSFNYWPIDTNVPSSFYNKDADWPDYFLFEPHLNIGYRF